MATPVLSDVLVMWPLVMLALLSSSALCAGHAIVMRSVSCLLLLRLLLNPSEM